MKTKKKTKGKATRNQDMFAEFLAFHNANRDVWRSIKEFCMDRRRKGFRHYSINAILEQVRWDKDKPTVSKDRFKINNNHRPFYARAYNKKVLKDFFFIREQTSKHTKAK